MTLFNNYQTIWSAMSKVLVYSFQKHKIFQHLIDIHLAQDYKFILFEYTSDMVELIESLTSNNIKYTKETDEWGLDYILI